VEGGKNLTSPSFSVNMDEVPISVALWVKEKWRLKKNYPVHDLHTMICIWDVIVMKSIELLKCSLLSCQLQPIPCQNFTMNVEHTYRSECQAKSIQAFSHQITRVEKSLVPNSSFTAS